jgi:hypothetical protein
MLVTGLDVAIDRGVFQSRFSTTFITMVLR